MTREQQTAYATIRARLEGQGGCAVLTVGSGCMCPLCALDVLAAALRAAPPAPDVYPNSDKGLAQMFPGVSMPMLRGIQEAAYRAGRESMADMVKRQAMKETLAAPPETAAPTLAPTRVADRPLLSLDSVLGAWHEWRQSLALDRGFTHSDGLRFVSALMTLTEQARDAALSSPVGETPADRKEPTS